MTQPIDEQLRSFRASIDNIDAALVHLLAERFKITQAVGSPQGGGRPAGDGPRREDQQVARLRALAAQSGLDPAFTEAFLRFILDEVIRHHEEICARRPRRRRSSTREPSVALSVTPTSAQLQLSGPPWRLDRGEEGGEGVEAHAAELQRLGVEGLGVEGVAVAGACRVTAIDPDPLADLVARRLAGPPEVAVDLVGGVLRAR